MLFLKYFLGYACSFIKYLLLCVYLRLNSFYEVLISHLFNTSIFDFV
jgi:hypothetical protein